MRKKLKKPALSRKQAGVYLCLFVAMGLFGFALPRREPLSFVLFYAALTQGLDPFLCAAGYLASSASALSLTATLSAAIQAAFLLLVFCLYRRAGRTPRWERLIYPLVAQLPFLFLFPEEGYAFWEWPPLAIKGALAVFLFLFSLLSEGGLRALLFRVFRARLAPSELTEIALLWVFLGLGILGSLGGLAFPFVALSALLFAGILMKSAAAVPFAAVLSLPLCLWQVSLLPLAEYTVYACLVLLFVHYHRAAAALALCAAYLIAGYFHGMYDLGALPLALSLLACLLPALVAVLLPDKLLKKAGGSLFFYRERTLPRVAINRNRRAVGQQLYEVSTLFREMEAAFTEKERPDRAQEKLKEKLDATLCYSCPNKRKCDGMHLKESFDKLIAVGIAKGRVNLIDLPAELAGHCINSAGMLFALNKLLGEYRRYCAELRSARNGRRLLAEQAHGVSEILRRLALEQSEEYTFSEQERTVSAALAAAGLMSYEIFLYGEEESFTVSITLEGSVTGKRLCKLVGDALHIPLSLAEKIPLSGERATFILRRKANFDASFGVASRPKDGHRASGDTHSILKIDERQFLVALSDGMGSGEEARSVSDRTLSLFESFYKAKMPPQTVLSAVNQLIAYSSDETFSCLDLAAVNLDTGHADVVKIGSPAGFLLSGEELKILEGESLPIGMLEAVHPATLSVTMQENDFLIFMSDGVTSAFGSVSDLCGYLSGLRPLNPQSLAEEILKTAVRHYGNRAEDDMTVLTVKLSKSA